MMSEQKHIGVSLKTSFRTLNHLTEETQHVWVVFHGQGQLTEFFLKKFEILDPGENFVIAPQGLSKYYLNGFTGRVGASWMTKEDRLTEIENQFRYIDAVLKSEAGYANQLVLFGFSQGVSAMMRYAARAELNICKMVAWAGTVPPELTREMTAHWPRFDGYYFIGDQDEFNRENYFDGERKKFEHLIGRPVEVNVFSGKHEVIPELLLKI